MLFNEIEVLVTGSPGGSRTVSRTTYKVAFVRNCSEFIT